MALASLRALALACVAALVLASCSSGDDDMTVIGRAGANKLVIAVGYDQPGLGVRRLDGVHKGFDVDVARYVAKELGTENVTFIEATPSQREKLLTEGKADLVVSTYSITDKRKEVIDFVGPYFVAGQDLLVRLTDTQIAGPESLTAGVRLCSVDNTTSAQYVKDQFAQAVELVNFPNFSDCVTALLAEQVDAMTTDDVILAGYAAQNPELLRVVGKPFSKEEYGIGLRRGDAAGKAKVAAAVQKMMDSGEWRRSLEANVGQSGYAIPQPPELVP
ncbi:glutamate ABC transporter substrate-binding protein [Saccharothrix algeriensis]|uniref:Glutamate ABC transporter substrate-binding protein n=1 Tax=Saccharothrix algeriensis TaxID=173560 RepID=A0A8T8I233_9PSEU|nr:glutamate ABC transporter substrate-binding protein [Saccharothrix algeriensis]MBM7810685.1 glutamate transport system substrate-binding protein [Saccharothrix algeriensis]QTR04757.1 glutamate ABC transporter substrate-binding protein [Saccharothrix algeriensis]